MCYSVQLCIVIGFTGQAMNPSPNPKPDVGVMSQQLQTRVELNSHIYQLTKEITH